ncbi:MAG: biopolymer transporter ExbD [Chthoniobacteraceae bacterium]|nr:biopolymer transporter ExbD [Chthoniobacteraceae bacterium]
MKFYERKRRMPAVIIVSLIDIFAILLIFVIVTSTFRRPQAAVTIKLPESSSGVPQPRAEAPNLAELTVSPEGAVTLDGAEVALEDLAGKIRAIVEAQRPFALKADTKAPFGVIVRVLDALKAGGVSGNLPAFTETIRK